MFTVIAVSAGTGGVSNYSSYYEGLDTPQEAIAKFQAEYGDILIVAVIEGAVEYVGCLIVPNEDNDLVPVFVV